MKIVVTILLVSSLYSYAYLKPHKSGANVLKYRGIMSLAASTLTLKDLPALFEKIEKIENSPHMDRFFKYNQIEELKSMIFLDVSRGDNFYEASDKIQKRTRGYSKEEKESFDESLTDFHHNAFRKRGRREFDSILGSNTLEDQGVSNVLQRAAMKTHYKYDMGKTKEEQMQEMKRMKQARRSGILKILPDKVVKFYDYFQSLRVEVPLSESLKSVGFGAIFAFVIWANMNARSSIMYYVIGNLALSSLLLTRGMPKVKPMPGMPRKKMATWSTNSFYTAIALMLLSAVPTTFLGFAMTLPLPLSLSMKWRLALMFSILTTSYFTSKFEVYEDKAKSGWRWEKAASDGSPDMKELLAEMDNGSQIDDSGDSFDFEYNPHIDEFPRQPKYIDELSPPDLSTSGGSGQLDEAESLKHYEDWKTERKDARRAPIEVAPPETPWVGGKAGMYVDKVPNWLSSSYKQFVLKSNSWRSQKAKYFKDTSEFEPIDGPKGFRDRRPDWLNIFGTGIWEEKTTISRRAARAFGAYRKSMWKIDKEVVLQKCDGADKEEVQKSMKK